jgi:hypothetical protein
MYFMRSKLGSPGNLVALIVGDAQRWVDLDERPAPDARRRQGAFGGRVIPFRTCPSGSTRFGFSLPLSPLKGSLPSRMNAPA